MRVYLDIYLAHNFGDDMFLRIIAEEFPKIQFVTNYYGRSYSKEFEKYDNVIFPKYPIIDRILNRLKVYDYISDVDRICRDTDACVFLGGSIFREECYWKSLLAWRTKLVDKYISQGKPVFIIGSNFGPVYTNEFIFSYRSFFEKCTDVCFRDKYSYSVFSNLESTRFEKDIVFKLPIQSFGKPEKAISISVIDPWHIPKLRDLRNQYIDWIAVGTAKLMEEGYEGRLVSLCDSEGDRNICELIRGKIESLSKRNLGRCRIVNYKDNMDEIFQCFDSSELIVASRFHANILALKMGKKLLPLTYSEKTTNVLKDIDFPGDIIPIERIAQYNMYDEVKMCLCAKQPVMDLTAASDSAMRQFAVLREYLVNK